MTGNDDRILENLSASGVALKKKTLEINFELDGKGVCLHAHALGSLLDQNVKSSHKSSQQLAEHES